MSCNSLLYEMRGKYEAIISLIEFLERKFREHGEDWAEDIDFNNFDFGKLAAQAWDKAKTESWYIPLSCNYLVLLLYSILEDTLNRVCKEVELNLGLNISLSDFAGRGIERATKYLIKVASLSDIKDNNMWKDIESWAIIRNAIAHSYGRINNADKIKKIPNTIKINDKSGEIDLNFKNVNDFCAVSRLYLEYIFKKLGVSG